MFQNSSNFRPRPGGGFNQSMGNFNEHLDQSAMQQSTQQKALTQQAADPASVANAVAQQKMAAQNQQKPREMGTLGEELIKRPVADIFNQLKTFFSINAWLGIEPAAEDPAKQAKQHKIMQRYNKLTQDQQQVAKLKYQESVQRKKQEEEERHRRKQIEAQQSAQEVSMPSSPQKGAQGPGGSKKQRSVQKLQNDRKTLSGPSSAN